MLTLYVNGKIFNCTSYFCGSYEMYTDSLPLRMIHVCNFLNS